MNTMQFSVAEWCLWKDPDNAEEFYSQLKQAGVDAVEMVAPARLASAKKAGLQILNIAAPGMEIGLNRADHHEELLPKIQKTIDYAGLHQIQQVILFSGNRAGQSDHEGIENCCRAIEELLPVAAQAKVTLAFEMLNTFEHKDYEADRSAFGFSIARRIASPYLKLLYDIYHMTRMEENVIEDITENITTITHLHIAESPKRQPPRAHGNIAYADIVPAAIKAGYRGYWGMEYLPGKKDRMSELAATLQLFRDLARA